MAWLGLSPCKRHTGKPRGQGKKLGSEPGVRDIPIL